MSVQGNPEALSRTEVNLRDLAAWAHARSAELGAIARAAEGAASQNDWVMRLRAGIIAHQVYMDDLASNATEAAAVIGLLASRIRGLQHESLQVQPVHNSFNTQTFDIHEYAAQQYRSEAATSLEQLMPGYQPSGWTAGTVAKGAWNFLVGDDLNTIWHTPGNVASDFGDGNWWGALGGILGGGLAVASLIPAGKLLKLGKVAKLGEAGYKATETAKLLEKLELTKYAKVLQISKGADEVWIKKVLGKDGRGGLAEQAIYQELLKENPHLIKLMWPHYKIDLYDAATNTIGSIKSIDPTAAAYAKNPAAFKKQIQKYVDDLRSWDDPYVKIWNKEDGMYDTDVLTNPNRELHIAIPSDGLTEAQAEALKEVLNDAAHPANNKPVINVIISEIER